MIIILIKNKLASSPACMGSMWCVAAQGVRTPFASPNGEQRGGLGWTLPTCAGLVPLGLPPGSSWVEVPRVGDVPESARGLPRKAFPTGPIRGPPVDRAHRLNVTAPAGCCASTSTITDRVRLARAGSGPVVVVVRAPLLYGAGPCGAAGRAREHLVLPSPGRARGARRIGDVIMESGSSESGRGRGPA